MNFSLVTKETTALHEGEYSILVPLDSLYLLPLTLSIMPFILGDYRTGSALMALASCLSDRYFRIPSECFIAIKVVCLQILSVSFLVKEKFLFSLISHHTSKLIHSCFLHQPLLPFNNLEQLEHNLIFSPLIIATPL